MELESELNLARAGSIAPDLSEERAGQSIDWTTPSDEVEGVKPLASEFQTERLFDYEVFHKRQIEVVNVG